MAPEMVQFWKVRVPALLTAPAKVPGADPFTIERLLTVVVAAP